MAPTEGVFGVKVTNDVTNDRAVGMMSSPRPTNESIIARRGRSRMCRHRRSCLDETEYSLLVLVAKLMINELALALAR